MNAAAPEGARRAENQSPACTPGPRPAAVSGPAQCEARVARVSHAGVVWLAAPCALLLLGVVLQLGPMCRSYAARPSFRV